MLELYEQGLSIDEQFAEIANDIEINISRHNVK